MHSLAIISMLAAAASAGPCKARDTTNAAIAAGDLTVDAFKLYPESIDFDGKLAYMR